MIPALFALLAALFAAMVWLTTHPGAAKAASPDPRTRLSEINELVMDPNRTFSISGTLAELDTIAAALPAGSEAERGRLAYLRGFVLYRAGRAEESVSASLEALDIHERMPFLSDRERSRFLYNLATQAEELGRWSVAVDAYREAAELFEGDASLSENQRLGTRERLAYCLHEAGLHEEAMEVNREVLAGGERLFGNDGEELLVVITNLAQNAHALGRPQEARLFLDRRLAIATNHGVEDHIDESLFQLGVLAFETGNPDKAEGFMLRRLELAKASRDTGRIADAQRDLDILYERLGR